MKNKNQTNKTNKTNLPFTAGICFFVIIAMMIYLFKVPVFIVVITLFTFIVIEIILTVNFLKMKELNHTNELLSKAYISNQLTGKNPQNPQMNRGSFPNQMNSFDNEEKTYKSVNFEEIQTTMADVAGAYEAKEELIEIIDFLKNPAKYNKMGAKIPKGVLFMGPPGTGKTLLAKAVAGEAGVKFLYCSGSSFVEKFVGVGAQRMRDLFAEAKKENAPCIIFIDEIDAIGGARNANGSDGEKDKTLIALLNELDGFDKNSSTIVIAATNRKDMLDEALLRPGRLGRQIYVGLPEYKERIDVLTLHSKGKLLANDVNIDSLARKTSGFSNAMLADVFNEGALLAVRFNKESISQEILEESIDRVMMGPAKKSHKYNENEKTIVAYHEAGHAVAGIVLENGRKVEKITIIPRGDAGGYTMSTPEEETFFTSKNSIENKIVYLLAGRAAEELLSDDFTSGASNDIEKATSLAKHYIKHFGMSSLGLMKIEDDASDKTSLLVDEEINKMLNKSHKDALELLKTHRALLDSISSQLLMNETINSDEIQMLADVYFESQAGV